MPRLQASEVKGKADEYLSEYLKCKADFDHFCRNYVLIEIPGRDVMLREPDDKIVQQKIIENIKILGPGSGYILSTGGGVNRGTPLRRLDMMIEMAKKYGRYKTKKELFEVEE